ncbi:MAG: sigma-70 family RNA polymerase sigma factor [Saprospiraceae bacterium]
MSFNIPLSLTCSSEGEISILQFIELYDADITKRIKSNLKQQKQAYEQVRQRVFEDLKQRFSCEQKYRTKLFWEATQQLVRKEVNMQNQVVFNNFNLTQEAFEQMLEALKLGDKTLFEQVFLTHFKACSRFLEDKFNASPADAYDATMEALIKFHKRLKAGKIRYGNLRYLFTQIAGQIYLKEKRLPQLQALPDDFDILDVPDETLPKETLALFARAWQELCQDCRGLLQSFYYDKITLVEIAQKTGKTDVALRKQKQRCLEKLRAAFNKIA